ncbi:MAG: polysaccharide deacetylase family protein [Nitrospirae bacterium]|uniref:polysaccharide deacetylase family protein n=1 Tax=Candidatus Magnetobacterium casense TaxID=1455061 RepID=UPI000698B591|nr:polysaccharide deacetylase family protein [Candidatus Magnetobacterium casensis]MBF0338319.1 polysaccharide deacetylase family protein [Nitrospirota bacterium]
MAAIPVLMYHHVNDRGSFINVDVAKFERQMQLIQRMGYRTLDTAGLLEVAARKTTPQRCLMITFDDGWLDNYVYAYPILKKYGHRAVIFVVTSRITDQGLRPRMDEGFNTPLPSHKECVRMVEEGNGTQCVLSWQELIQMERSGVIDVQSHTHTHARFDTLYEDNDDRLAQLHSDLQQSKALIQERLGKACHALCWPWGIYDQGWIATATQAGFKALFTTRTGTNTAQDSLLEIKRLVIGNVGEFAFRKKLFIHSSPWLSRAYVRVFK